MLYDKPSRYNWMLQFYLREQGLGLSWVGSGRMIWSLNYEAAEVDEVATRFVAAAQAMQRDGWWHEDDGSAQQSNKQIRRSLLIEMLRRKFNL